MKKPELKLNYLSKPLQYVKVLANKYICSYDDDGEYLEDCKEIYLEDSESYHATLDDSKDPVEFIQDSDVYFSLQEILDLIPTGEDVKNISITSFNSRDCMARQYKVILTRPFTDEENKILDQKINDRKILVENERNQYEKDMIEYNEFIKNKEIKRLEVELENAKKGFISRKP